MDIENVNPDTLKPSPWNPREITDDALDRLATLLDSHGFVDPIIARRKDGLILGGHQRIKANAMREQPDKTVPVIFLDGLPDSRAKALTVALNNPAAQGAWDYPKLADLLQEIDTGEFSVAELTAFSAEDMAGLMHGLDDCIPSDNADIDEDALAETNCECPKCGFRWQK